MEIPRSEIRVQLPAEHLLRFPLIHAFLSLARFTSLALPLLAFSVITSGVVFFCFPHPSRNNRALDIRHRLTPFA